MRSSSSHPFLAPLVDSPAGNLSAYGAMLAIWHLRPATQRRFPLQHGYPRDWLRYLAWCSTDGRKDYAMLREIPEWDAELNRPVDLPPLLGDRWKDCHSLAGRDFDFSPATVGTRYAARLREIWSQHGAESSALPFCPA